MAKIEIDIKVRFADIKKSDWKGDSTQLVFVSGVSEGDAIAAAWALGQQHTIILHVGKMAIECSWDGFGGFTPNKLKTKDIPDDTLVKWNLAATPEQFKRVGRLIRWGGKVLDLKITPGKGDKYETQTHPQDE